MRTTIEITNKQRAALLAIAAARGIKGFSAVVQEALDSYLADQVRDADSLAAAKAARGSLDPPEADQLADSCAQIRAQWR